MEDEPMYGFQPNDKLDTTNPPGTHELEKEKTFWLVWCPGKHNPSYRHNSYESAIKEAQRLAELNIGSDFYVMKALMKAEAIVSTFETFLKDA